MDAIEILVRCRDAKREIKQLTDRLTRLRECATSTSARYDRIGGRPSGVGDKVSAFAVEIAACEEEIAVRSRKYEAELLAACKIADTLPEPECGVLYRYFVQGQTQRGIANALNYSMSYVKAKKANGVKLAGAIPEDAASALLPEWYLRSDP